MSPTSTLNKDMRDKRRRKRPRGERVVFYSKRFMLFAMMSNLQKKESWPPPARSRRHCRSNVSLIVSVLHRIDCISIKGAVLVNIVSAISPLT